MKDLLDPHEIDPAVLGIGMISMDGDGYTRKCSDNHECSRVADRGRPGTLD
jgi:hypothetical protein